MGGDVEVGSGGVAADMLIVLSNRKKTTKQRSVSTESNLCFGVFLHCFLSFALRFNFQFSLTGPFSEFSDQDKDQ
jgi:hypothetical protein